MATLYYWTRSPGHVSLLMNAPGGGELYVSHLPNRTVPASQTEERGKRPGLPSFGGHVLTVIRYPKLSNVTLEADLEDWGVPEAVLELSDLVDDGSMAIEARNFLGASATIDHTVEGYHAQYSYYQLAEGAPPTHIQNPNWLAQRRQCVTTTNRLLYYGIPHTEYELRRMLGEHPRRPRDGTRPFGFGDQPWLPEDVYDFCWEHLRRPGG